MPKKKDKQHPFVIVRKLADNSPLELPARLAKVLRP
jgi:hypothetical protein